MVDKKYTWKHICPMFGITEERNSFMAKSERGDIPHYKKGKNNYRHWTVEDLPKIGAFYSQTSVMSRRPKRTPVVNFYVTKGGGSHKTTSAFNLACNFALSGLKVLVIDLDFQMNISTKYGINNLRSAIEAGGVFHKGLAEVLIDGIDIYEAITPSSMPNVDIIPASSNLVRLETWLVSQVRREEKLSKKIAPLKESYDIIIMDNNPSWSQISINALFACDLNVASIGLDSNTIEALPQFFETLEYAEIDLNDQILLCGQDESTSIKAEIKEALEATYPGIMCRNTIRKSTKVDEANLQHLPVLLYEPKHNTSDDFRKVTEEIWTRVIKSVDKADH